jgi:hypothetical protein
MRGGSLSVVGLERRIVLIIDCFMYMVVLVLELLIVRWCSFELCLTLQLYNWRRQVNVAPWSTRFHLLFELAPLSFRIHMSQIT